MENKTVITLMGINIDPDTEDSDFFVLMESDFDKATDVPLTSEGYLLFFQDIALAKKTLNASDYSDKEGVVLPTEEALTADVAQAMYLLQEQSFDDRASLIHFYNIFFDLLAATPFGFPEEYQTPLYAFADHTTFDKDFGSFFEKSGFDRPTILKASVWLVGTIFSNLKIVR